MIQVISFNNTELSKLSINVNRALSDLSGIDPRRKLINDLIRKASEFDRFISYFKKFKEECERYKHTLYTHGEKQVDWAKKLASQSLVFEKFNKTILGRTILHRAKIEDLIAKKTIFRRKEKSLIDTWEEHGLEDYWKKHGGWSFIEAREGEDKLPRKALPKEPKWHLKGFKETREGSQLVKDNVKVMNELNKLEKGDVPQINELIKELVKVINKFDSELHVYLRIINGITDTYYKISEILDIRMLKKPEKDLINSCMKIEEKHLEILEKLKV